MRELRTARNGQRHDRIVLLIVIMQRCAAVILIVIFVVLVYVHGGIVRIIAFIQRAQARGGAAPPVA